MGDITLTAKYYTVKDTDYIGEDGVKRSVSARVLDGSTKYLTKGWYVVDSSYTIGKITCLGDVNLIIADDCRCTVGTGSGFDMESGTSLTIFGQDNSNGQLIAKEDFSVRDFSQYGGSVVSENNMDCSGKTVISAGSFEVRGDLSGSDALKISGGKTKILGSANVPKIQMAWKNISDSVFIGEYPSDAKVSIKEGQMFRSDEKHFYEGVLTQNEINEISYKTLMPYVAELNGYTLSLDGDIAVNFYMQVHGDPEELIAKDSYMLFTIGEGDAAQTQKVSLAGAGYDR